MVNSVRFRFPCDEAYKIIIMRIRFLGWRNRANQLCFPQVFTWVQDRRPSLSLFHMLYLVILALSSKIIFMSFDQVADWDLVNLSRSLTQFFMAFVTTWIAWCGQIKLVTCTRDKWNHYPILTIYFCHASVQRNCEQQLNRTWAQLGFTSSTPTNRI